MTSTASPAAAKRPKSAILHQIQVTFQSEASKLEFLSQLDRAKQRLFPTSGSIDNYHLLTNILDLLDGGSSGAGVQQEESASPYGAAHVGFIRLVIHGARNYLAISVLLSHCQ